MYAGSHSRRMKLRPSAQPSSGSARLLLLRRWTKRCSTRSPLNSRPRRSGSRPERSSTPIIASASEDGEARWVQHKGRAAVHGFKAYVGADPDTALAEEVAVTPANVNDGKAGPDAPPDEPGEILADSAYRANFPRGRARQGRLTARRSNRYVGPR